MAGRPKGAENKDKPFKEALRLEIASMGADHKALRDIARNLILTASMPGKDAVSAIREIADRLDGKPTQAIEHSGEMTRYVARIPDKKPDAISWQQQHAPNPKTIQ